MKETQILGNFLFTALILTNWGCVKKGDVSISGNGSPFSQRKLIINSEPSSSVKLSTSSSGQSIQLDVVANKQCLFNRAQKQVRGFIESYLPASAPISANDLKGFPEFAFSASFPLRFPKGTLSDLIEADPCIVGASNSKSNLLKLSYTDSRYADQDYLKAIRFEEADSVFRREISTSSKVKVAFLDSGFDLTNEDRGPIAENLDGLNLLDRSANVQDQVGHGTSVSSIVTATTNNQKGLVGIASANTVLVPVKLFNSQTQVASSWMVFDAIARSVNSGAEIINISFVSYDSACDPVIGHGIYRAIEKGVAFVFSAGAGIKVKPDGTVERGEIYSPSDNQATEGPTVAPACWGRYFKGALTVGGLNERLTNLDPNSSNWGPAIEIAAPAKNLAVYGLQNEITRKAGTSLSAPMVTGALALIAAFFKENKWQGSPWLYEDILLQGSDVVPSLRAEFSGGRVLNLKKLADYLVSLKVQKPEDRLHLPSDNQEDGRGLNPDIGAGRVIRLEVYTKTPNIRNSDRAQFNAVAYYENNSFRVITSQAQWRSSSSDIRVDSQGVASVAIGKLGQYRVFASYQGLEESTQISVIPFNPVTGNSNSLEDIVITYPQSDLVCCMTDASLTFKAEGNYGSQRKRDISSSSSWSTPTPQEIKTGLGLAGYIVDIQDAVPNKAYIVTAAYEGKIGRKEIVFPPVQFDSFRLGLPTKSIFTQGEKVEVGALLALIMPGGRKSDRLIVPDWKSNSPLVLSMLNKSDQGKYWRNINTQELTPGKYQISARYFYRADGNPRFVETSIWEFTVEQSPLQSLELEIQHPFGRVPNDSILLGSGALVRVHGVLANGAKVVPPLQEIDFQILDANKQRSPLMAAKEVSNMFSTHIFGRSVGEQIWFQVTHKSTGIKLIRSFSTYGILKHDGAFDLIANTIPNSIPIPQPDNFCLDKGEKNPFAGGTGIATDPFLICSLTQLKNASSTSLQSRGMNANNLYFRLRTNIDMTPAGNLAINPLNLAGHWDGGGFELQNPTAIDAEKLYLGALCTIQCGIKTVRNMGIRNPNIRGRAYVGAFVGGSGAERFENIYVTQGQVIGESDVGGILGNTGFNESLVRVLNVGTRVFSERGPAGGIVGTFTGRFIESAYARTDLSYIGVPSNSSLLSIGGIVGSLSGSGSRCSSADLETTKLSSASDCSVFIRDSGFVGSIRVAGTGGGIVGKNWGGIILRSWVSAQIMSTFGSVGGIVGSNTGQSGYTLGGLIFACNATGQIWGGASTSSRAGGIVGTTDLAIIQQNNSQMEVSGNDFLGGVAGEVGCFNQFRRNQSQSVVVKSGDSVGGFFGQKICSRYQSVPEDIYESNRWSRNQNSGLFSIGMLLKKMNVDVSGIVAE